MTEWNRFKVGGLYTAVDEVWMVVGIDGPSDDWTGEKLMTLHIIGPRGAEEQTVMGGLDGWLVEVV